MKRGPAARARPPRAAYDIDGAPELASVDALAAVLQIAVAAVLAANPELLTGHPIDRRDDLPAQVWIADAIVSGARAIRELLDRYREALRASEATGSRDPDDDVPF